MRAVAKIVQRICLENEHCKRQTGAAQYYAEQRKIERKCVKRNKKAVQLFNQGIPYPDIAKKVGCNVSSLYRELNKRGVLQMPQ